VLDAKTPLSGFDETIGDVHIREVTGKTIVSLAIPLGGHKAAVSIIKKGFGLACPEPGLFSDSEKPHSVLLWTSPDQFFLIREEDSLTPAASAESKLSGKAYVTDQSDSWAILSLNGSGVTRALERICPLDLKSQALQPGSAARTQMEHLGVTILRISQEEWWLLSARSSAKSFLHAITQSARNIS
jgi:sarcosine oxidase subunit gamma